MRFVAPLDKGLHLRRVPLFGDLAPDMLGLLVQYASEELIPAGTVFQTAGEPVEKIRVIVEGDVSCRLPDGKTFHLGPDSVVGVFEHFAGGAPSTLSASTETLVLSIPTEAIHGILEDHFDVVVHIFRGLGRTLIRALRDAPTLAGSAQAPDLSPHAEHPALDEVGRIVALRSSLPFRYASVDGLASLVRTMRIESFARDAILWTQSDEASWLGVILHGVVECTTGFRPGKFYFSEDGTNAVGFLDTLSDDRRWYDARAATDVTVLTIRKDDLLDTLEDHFDMALACLAAFAEFSLGIVARIRGAPGLPPNEIVAVATTPDPPHPTAERSPMSSTPSARTR
jgi:CRP-like cAMP-binding protein